MRHLQAILFIGLLVVPGITCFCFLQWQKASVRHDVKESLIHGMDRDSLTSLKFSMNDAATLLDWEHEREFEYAGQMYDVVEAEEVGDSITYYCWKDHEETHLNTLLSSLTTNALNKDPLHESSRNKAIDILKIQFLVPSHDLSKIDLIPARPPSIYIGLAISRLLLPPPVPPPIST